MSGIIKKFAVSIVCLIIIIISVLYFIQSVAEPESGQQNLILDLDNEVKIYRNDFQLPHICTDHADDAYFGLGYCHAEDRLWQMDIQRRRARGLLAEILGPEFLDFDYFIRCLQLVEVSQKTIDSLDEKTLSVLQSYAEGVNTYINENRDKLPYEFTTLGYSPEPWQPVDCILSQRLIALEYSVGFKTDMIVAEVARRLGPAKALSFLKFSGETPPYILRENPNESYYEYSRERKLIDSVILADSLKAPMNPGDTLLPDSSLGSENISAEVKALISGVFTGSNAWAIRKSHEGKSGAIIAADPHGHLSLPSRWYPVHLSARGLNCIGLTVPGQPFIYYGRNDSISWSSTNMMLDDCDFMIINTIKDSADYYKDENGARQKFHFVKDTIKIRDSLDFVYYHKLAGSSEILSGKRFASYYSDFIGLSGQKRKSLFEKYDVVMNWTGHKAGPEAEILLKLQTANDYNNFKNALDDWQCPALVFTYADAGGNIAVVPAGRAPVRRKECQAGFLNRAWDKSCLWDSSSTVRIGEALFNPEKNYVVSANNPLDSPNEIDVPGYWYNYSRALRIEELLKHFQDVLKDEYTISDAGRMQIDVMSPYALKLLSIAMPVLDSAFAKMNSDEQEGLKLLKDWDFNMFPHKSEPLIYSTFKYYLIENIFSDDLGHEYLNSFSIIGYYIDRKLLSVLKNNDEKWLDIKKTSVKENRAMIIRRSFEQAVSYLLRKTEVMTLTELKWGDFHVLKIGPDLSFIDILEPAQEIGSFPMGGDNNTINLTAWDLRNLFSVQSASRSRFITDMSDSVVRISVPGGVSSYPISDHYNDLYYLWMNGGFVDMSIRPAPAEGYSLRTVLK